MFRVLFVVSITGGDTAGTQPFAIHVHRIYRESPGRRRREAGGQRHIKHLAAAATKEMAVGRLGRKVEALVSGIDFQFPDQPDVNKRMKGARLLDASCLPSRCLSETGNPSFQLTILYLLQS